MDRSAVTRISAMGVPPRRKRVYLLHLALCSSYKNSLRDSSASSGTREIPDDATKRDDGACTMRLGVTSHAVVDAGGAHRGVPSGHGRAVSGPGPLLRATREVPLLLLHALAHDERRLPPGDQGAP